MKYSLIIWYKRYYTNAINTTTRYLNLSDHICPI